MDQLMMSLYRHSPVTKSNDQCTRMLRELRANKKFGVPNYRFIDMRILKYSSRIAELRQEGYNIIAERQRSNGRATGVWNYFLIENE